MYTDILIPTDGSDYVQSAIQYGLDLAGRYNATVHGLHVIDSSPIEQKFDLTALETDLGRFRTRGMTLVMPPPSRS